MDRVRSAVDPVDEQPRGTARPRRAPSENIDELLELLWTWWSTCVVAQREPRGLISACFQFVEDARKHDGLSQSRLPGQDHKAAVCGGGERIDRACDLGLRLTPWAMLQLPRTDGSRLSLEHTIDQTIDVRFEMEDRVDEGKSRRKRACADGVRRLRH